MTINSVKKGKAKFTKSSLRKTSVDNPNWRGGYYTKTIERAQKSGKGNLLYKCGVYYERKTIIFLKKEGYSAIRSPGSKGPFDIWAINDVKIRLIQVKVGTRSLRKKELINMREFIVPSNCTKEIWQYVRRESPIITVI